MTTISSAAPSISVEPGAPAKIVRPIQSMTGYASLSNDAGGQMLNLELRSVNSRFLDLIFKLPDELRAMEPLLRERLSALIQRGKVECRISVTKSVGEDRWAAVNDGLLDQLLAAAQLIGQKAPNAAALTQADLLRWPGVMRETNTEASIDIAPVLSSFDELMQQFQDSRAREGEKLVALLIDCLVRVEQLVAQLAPKVPALVKLYGEKMTERMQAALLEAGAGTGVPIEEMFSRIRQEATVYAMKIDVAEELGRLGAHALEMRRVLGAGGPAGKRLDFLMQEFNREANTLGSKGLDMDVSRTSVELKILIEQMREQIQNLE